MENIYQFNQKLFAFMTTEEKHFRDFCFDLNLN